MQNYLNIYDFWTGAGEKSKKAKKSIPLEPNKWYLMIIMNDYHHLVEILDNDEINEELLFEIADIEKDNNEDFFFDPQYDSQYFVITDENSKVIYYDYFIDKKNYKEVLKLKKGDVKNES